MGDVEEQLRAARNQSLYREVNERIAVLNASFGRVLSMADWVCECADPACSEPIRMTTAEYEAVRARETTFAVLDGHVLPEVERVIDGTDRYVVVEKIEAAAEYAAVTDPRG